MKMVFLLAGLMLPLESLAPAREDMSASPASPSQRGPALNGTPNLYADRDGCTSIPRQVAGEDRRYGSTRLDQQPPGQLLLAVHRTVDGCPVVTFAREERRR